MELFIVAVQVEKKHGKFLGTLAVLTFHFHFAQMEKAARCEFSVSVCCCFDVSRQSGTGRPSRSDSHTPQHQSICISGTVGGVGGCQADILTGLQH